MVSAAAIPENIRQDIAIYLAPGENIQKAISSESGKTVGELWLLLTTNSIFFHTREHKKEPVIALIGRDAVKEIDYFQKPAEIVLTFIPAKNQSNTTRLTFPIDKKTELEDFCEDLADLINFRMETKSGVKVYPKPEEPEKDQKKSEKKTETSPAKQEGIVTAKQESVKSEKPRTNESVRKEPAKTQTEPLKATPEVKIVAPGGQTLSESGAPTARYIVVATIVSLLVAYIWYLFFKAISGRQSK